MDGLSLPPSEKAVLALVFGAVIAVKAAVIVIYAPATLGDQTFINAADEILSGPRWLSDAGLDAAATPATLWRPIGYSLMIAGTKLLVGAAWPYALCAAQAALSFCAGLLLMRLCLAAGMGATVATGVFVLYQASVPLSTDVLVMEDAVVGALGMAALYSILRPVIEGRIPSVSAFIIAGLLVGVSFLLRDVYHFVMPILGGAAFVLLAWKASWRQGSISAVALVAPVFLAAAGLQLWNEHRTGRPVTTTAGQSAYVYAVLRAAEHDPAVIAGPTKVEAVLRETNQTFDYVDTGRAVGVLFTREGMDSVAQFQTARDLFWWALLKHPGAFFKAAMKRLRFVQQASLFASPLTRLDDLHWWAGGATEEGYRTGWRADALRFSLSRDVADLTLPVFIHLGVRKASQLVGIALFSIFLAGTPLLWLLLRQQVGAPADAAAVAWAVYGLWVCLYLPVSFEVRYLSPVIGPALFATALVVINGRSLTRAAYAALSSVGATLRS